MWKKIFLMVLLVSLGSGTLLPGCRMQEVYADEAAVPVSEEAAAPASAETPAAAPVTQDVPVPPETGTFTASVIHVPAAFTNDVAVILENYNTESEVTMTLGMGNGYTSTVEAETGSYNLVGLNVEGDNPDEWKGTVWQTKYAVSGGMDTEITIQLKSDKAVESEAASTASASDSSTASAAESGTESYDLSAITQALTGGSTSSVSTGSAASSKETASTASRDDSSSPAGKTQGAGSSYAYPVILIGVIALGCVLVIRHGKKRKK